MKVKIKAHIHYNKYRWDDKGEFEVFSFKLDDDEHRTYVGEQEIEIDVPDDYDPRAQQIAALEKQKQKVMADFTKTFTEINVEKQKQKVMADFTKTFTEINDRISKLQALEFTA